jgi:hypothetical protein
VPPTPPLRFSRDDTSPANRVRRQTCASIRIRGRH